jgi:putative oxidoreductase
LRNNLMEGSMIDTKPAYAALLLRVSMGVMFLAHGLLLKVMTFGVAGTVGFFGSIGYPPLFAYLVIVGEVLGGIALILGVWTRVVSLLLLPILLGALAVHLPNGWVFNAPRGGWEFPAFWSMALVAQALLGDGAHALGDLRRFIPGRRIAAA